ncbi:MAG: MTAP family purine nucleoside phosphorylase [Syntrophorhabdales bacterium]|nr:MTAP family purine nucleoside phosphorylase [Syntrophorhabdales bacterium]
MKAIIGGSSLFGSQLFDKWEKRVIKTPYGETLLKIKGDYIFLQRHGSPIAPAHKINHRANIWALKDMAIEMAISINSVGSLKVRLKPGSIIIPHDFISLWHIETFYDDEMRGIIPIMHEGARRLIIETCRDIHLEITDNGIYIQTRGPRFETKAEINLLKRFGDVVGMTMASEATLSMEYELPYASLCSIDNYCHGITKIPLTTGELEKNWQKNLKYIEKFLKQLIG